jgi:LPXTG-site transpeptidase (sortase) family protein
MRFIKKLGRIAFRIFSSLLFLGLLIGIGYLFFYPNQNKIQIIRSNLNIERQSYNFTLRLFGQISPPELFEPDIDTQIGSIEQISPEELAKVTNEGQVFTTLEEYNTNLQISSADINARIREGADGNAMKKGPWHFPLSVAPGDRGNSIIIGHRFAEVPPSTNTFFNLDKIEVGDKIQIESDNEEYAYTVVMTQVVEKYDRSILAPTSDYRITLITCHPKWTSDKRLVVIGILDKLHRNI